MLGSSEGCPAAEASPDCCELDLAAVVFTASCFWLDSPWEAWAKTSDDPAELSLQGTSCFDITPRPNIWYTQGHQHCGSDFSLK